MMVLPVTYQFIEDVPVQYTDHPVRDVNETRETRDSKKFLGMENFISHGQEFQAAGPHARSFSDRHRRSQLLASCA